MLWVKIPSIYIYFPILYFSRMQFMLYPQYPVIIFQFSLSSFNLQLIPSSFVVPNGQGFYFQYTLFGNKVSSEIFWDIFQPEFAPERASVRINSHMKLLRTFLHSFSGVKVSMSMLVAAGVLLGEGALLSEDPYVPPPVSFDHAVCFFHRRIMVSIFSTILHLRTTSCVFMFLIFTNERRAKSQSFLQSDCLYKQAGFTMSNHGPESYR